MKENDQYLIDESNNLPPQPGQIQCPYINSIQQDHAVGWVIEALQQGSDSGFSFSVL